MTLLGITGSFGRYVEHYLQRGLIRKFFQRTGAAVAVLTTCVVLAMWSARPWVSWCLFGSAEQTGLLVPALMTLVSSILYCYFLEVVIALRRIKVGSTMELISSWVFALLSIVLLNTTDLGSYGVILGFAGGNLLGALYAFSVVSGMWDRLPQSDDETFTHLSLWQKVAPFAIGLWMVNIVTNVFDMVDRYMIVHFSGIPATEAQGLVGQYFSSMAIPMLMVGVSVTLSHLVMPYLSKDWEEGRFEAVSDRVNLSTKLIGLMLAAGSTVILLIAPFLFDVVFGGKYDAGLAVLPWTVAFCFWKSRGKRFLQLSLLCGTNQADVHVAARGPGHQHRVKRTVAPLAGAVGSRTWHSDWMRCQRHNSHLLQRSAWLSVESRSPLGSAVSAGLLSRIHAYHDCCCRAVDRRSPYHLVPIRPGAGRTGRDSARHSGQGLAESWWLAGGRRRVGE